MSEWIHGVVNMVCDIEWGGGGVPVLFLVTGTKNRVLVPTCTDMYS